MESIEKPREKKTGIINEVYKNSLTASIEGISLLPRRSDFYRIIAFSTFVLITGILISVLLFKS